ncbi:MAG: MliC family protein [Pseudomonadota bacterium]
MASTSQAQPSFDCAAATHAAEKAICASADLSAMDRELARLYDLARAGPNMTADRADSLRATQRDWIKGRNACWTTQDPQKCARDAYALRIDDLRRSYSEARAQPGLSTGPFAYSCTGIDALISATYVQAGDPVVVLRWRDRTEILPIARSASGARYQDGQTVFWTKGPEGTFTYDGTDHSCQQEDTG